MCGAETQPALVLAPLRVAASTWPDEAVKWGHLRNIEVQPIVGTAKARALRRWQTATPACSPSTTTIWCGWPKNSGGRWPFATVIPDESTRLKSFRLRGGGKPRGSTRQSGTQARAPLDEPHRHTGAEWPGGFVGASVVCRSGATSLGRTYGAFTSRWFNSIQFPGQSWTKAGAIRSLAGRNTARTGRCNYLAGCRRLVPISKSPSIT